jgi:serralysin
MLNRILAGLTATLLLGASALAFIGSGKPTITDVVVASGGEFDNDYEDFDILLNAVLTAGLQDVLADRDATFTVFAPKDRAFVALARDLGYTGIDEEESWNFLVATLTTLGGGDPLPILTDVLTYHVLPEEVGLFQFIQATFTGSDFTTVQGGTIEPLLLRLRDKEPDLADPRIAFPLNLRVANGVIHSINRVLIPVDLP